MDVNKQELADILRCALPTLDRLMARYGDSFPVVQHGAKGREYRFDPEAVISFVQAREAERRATDAQRDELMAQFTIPGIEPAAAGLKPSDQLALARAPGAWPASKRAKPASWSRPARSARSSPPS
jgi:phage terminase Nu1 subunit (DNA packaging protein)